jgi:hypothetical protein
MKKNIVLGICLLTTVSVFAVRHTNNNEHFLGDASLVKNQKLMAYEANVGSTTALLSAKVVKLVDYWIKEQQLIWVVDGSVEQVVADARLEDEISSKLKTL